MKTTDFCNCCGDWIGPAEGGIIIDTDGDVVAVCADCQALQTGLACSMLAGARSGTIRHEISNQDEH